MKHKPIDIHDYDKQLSSVLHRIQNHRKISSANKRTLLQFHQTLLAESLSRDRVVYYLNSLAVIATWLKTKDFKKVTRPDIEAIMRRINQMDYTEWTMDQERLPRPMPKFSLIWYRQD